MLARFQLLILRKIFCFAELAMMVVYIRVLQGKDERRDAVAEQSEVNPDFAIFALCSAEYSKGNTSGVMRQQSRAKSILILRYYALLCRVFPRERRQSACYH